MEHPDSRTLARYALGEITDDAELAALEDHLLVCDHCSRRAFAVDLIGSAPTEGNEAPVLHITSGSSQPPVALCGDQGSRNIISEALISGIDSTLICAECLALLRGGAGKAPQYVN